MPAEWLELELDKTFTQISPVSKVAALAVRIAVEKKDTDERHMDALIYPSNYSLEEKQIIMQDQSLAKERNKVSVGLCGQLHNELTRIPRGQDFDEYYPEAVDAAVALLFKRRQDDKQLSLAVKYDLCTLLFELADLYNEEQALHFAGLREASEHSGQ